MQAQRSTTARFARRLLPMLLASAAGLAAAQGYYGGAGQPMPGNAFPTQPGGMQQPGMPGGYPGGMPGQMQPQMPGGMQPGQMPSANLDELMQWERQDMGVPATRELHGQPFHGPTPNQLPGGQVITTKGLLPLLQQRGMNVLVFDVLGAGQALPGAVPLVWAAQPGSFNDPTQQQLAQQLQQATQGRNDVPMVFYCGGPQCWMSYNAALRAVRLGYRNVLWYRGGMEAWQRAGQQFEMLAQR